MQKSYLVNRQMKVRRDPAKVAARLAKRIREARLRTGLTQAAVARTMGVSYQVLQKYETGTTGIYVDRFMALVAALRVPPELLLPGVTTIHAVSKAMPVPDGEEERILALYRRLDEERRKTVRRMLRRLATAAASA